MAKFPCPYLNADVELTEEREAHISDKHPDLLPEHRNCIVKTLADPDEVRRDNRFPNSQLFSRWFPGVKGGKFIVVVVVADPDPVDRYWIVTAYLARQLSGGSIAWKRP